MTKFRFSLTLNCLLLISLILSSCSGIPNIRNLIAQPTATVPSATVATTGQAAAPALVETDPVQNTVIGHQVPITFYFNQAMNKTTVEAAISGLPAGTFTWNDEATLVFTPAQPYIPNTKINIEIANTIQSASGFGITEPIQLSYTVADYLRAVNQLPKPNTTDADVDAAIAVSFNQPVVPLGADPASLSAPFVVQPEIEGKGEWISTSTYVFYPKPSMLGGTEYTVSVNQDIKTASGVGLDGSVINAWKFLTTRPRVVEVSPSPEGFMAPDAEVKLTFNQPMDKQSVQLSFLLNGPEGPANGKYAWNDEGTELTFKPDSNLTRGFGYTLNVGKAAKSKGGMTLGTDYGTVLNVFADFAVSSSDTNYGGTTFIFNAPLAKGDYKNLVTVSPPVENFDVNVDVENKSLYLYGNFIPDTDYSIELSATIGDQWGQLLNTPFKLDVHTPALPASISLKSFGYSTAFVRPDEPALYATAINVQNTDITVAPLSLQDFFTLQNSYDLQQSYTPAEPSTYSQVLETSPEQNNAVKLALTQANTQLLPGMYYVSIASPQIQSKTVYFAASSQVNLTFKLGATDALVWAMDLSSQTPVANTPVYLYDEAGNTLASGSTDANGIWRGPAIKSEGTVFAALGTPGTENFALAFSNWNTGVNAWDFGYAQNTQAPHTQIYMYTDRPIYRPGQTVYYRGIVRQAFNGRYELPNVKNVPIVLNDAQGTQLTNINTDLSPYGSFNGQIELSQDAVPGYYTFTNEGLNFFLSFQVAEYRKPEINLGLELPITEIKQGATSQANVNARYFFDAPAGNTDVKWSLYEKPDHFYLPEYETGLIDASWLDMYRLPSDFDSRYFGSLINEGTGQTTPSGTLSINLPAIPETDSPKRLTLEVTATEDSGLPVSTRKELFVHPADFYIGLHPDQWFGPAKSELGFEVYTVDWERNPSSGKLLTAEFKQVRWDRETDTYGNPQFTPVYTSVSSSNLATGPDGKARLSFVPPTAGTYMLDVSGDGAHSQVLVWVGGAGTAAWPDLPNQRLQLTADKESYLAGDTAKVFIPNPFATKSYALVTVERGLISKADMITLNGSGSEYTLPLTEDDAPNVYVSVTVLGQGNNFRQGFVNLPVAPDAQNLKVQVISNPAQAGPRDQVTFDVLVTDNKAQPVQGEFSLSVVDLATLALADPNAEDILPAFYHNQPLGIETGISLAAYGGRDALEPGGLGGGGGEDTPFVREDFPDTAYWNPSLITTPEGRGQVTMTLPDSLTTWHVDVRGTTMDTKVGQAETQIVSTKPLLIRPVTPRFLVSGDHVLMAALVNNNTADKLNVTVNIQSDGFVLDSPESATRSFEVSPNSQARVEWWGTASLAQSADMVFSVKTNGSPSLQDSARPVWGKLPILQYSAPQAFVTGGVLRGASSQQEVISLPRTFTPGPGSGLDVELSPSLAGSLLSALEAMEVPPYSISAEASLSYLLPNIEVHRALNNAGLSDPALSERIEKNLNASVSRLLFLQNPDGGWSWWGQSVGENGATSDPYISAYVLFGLLRAQQVGSIINQSVLDRATGFLHQSQKQITAKTTGAELDDAAFIQYVLKLANSTDQTAIDSLYGARDRMSPTGLAWVACVLNSLNPADPHVKELVSKLETSAIRTASSAHWETPTQNIISRGSPIYTTSIVVYVLAQIDSANTVMFDAVRYLAAHRNASKLWNIGHENAWAMVALNEAMVGLGDLRADFKFNAALNGSPLTGGDVNGIQLAPLKANVPLEFLSPNSPNLLTIQREDGLGRLYYNAVLKVNRPVQDVKPLDMGMGIERTYCLTKQKTCSPLSSLKLASDQFVTAQLTLNLPHDSYYVMVEDHIPAGMEILDNSLKTSQLGVDSTDVQAQFDDTSPFADGWGWWLFNQPQIHDEGILFTADHLPAGTYVLTYTLIPVQAGEFRVLPAHAWQSFFPEVQGTSAGTVFEIKP
ncbi:MAG: Ig-like domain-containing protein [Anaerolineales bacterium]|nr:Ig-like domain-containing protein [Anaerolineales bacterium]